MSTVFSDAHLKIDRANKHIVDIQARVQTLTDSHTATIETDANTGKKLIKHDLSDRKARTDIALMVGDTVHNLNCALDHAWWKIRERLPSESLGSDLRDKFPVFIHPNEVRGHLEKRKIDRNFPELFRILIDEIQPYKGGNSSIWPIHEAGNMDKHRILLPFIYFASIEGVEFEDKMGRIDRKGFWPTMQNPPHYVEIPDGFYVKNCGHISLGILFHEDVFGQEFRAVDSLKFFAQSVLGVVELLEDL
jgi:hypothetical protein